VHATLHRQLISDYTLLFTWKGTTPDLPPIVLMAHQDVVPVEEASLGEWQQPPFDGKIADGYLWGRGTLDIKCQLVTILEAVEDLLKTGYEPKRTIYLAFGHDEENGGNRGTRAVVEWMQQNDIRPAVVLDEGGMILEKLLPGVSVPVALVGTGEKGVVTLELSVEDTPGHSSTPKRETTIGILARALAFVEHRPMPARLTFFKPTLRAVGSVLPFWQQFALANTWLLGGLVIKKLSANPQVDAALRTTTAITIVNGGVRENVIPSRASARVNFRLMPGDGIAKVCEHVRKVIDDERVRFEPVGGFVREASPVSPVDTPSYRALERTIRQMFSNIPVAPFLVLGGTDSRHFYAICDEVYRFTPLAYSHEDMHRVHGFNERILIDDLGRMVQFYVQLIGVWGGVFEE
jgi:carboxypeptidase PM20D1